jgi:hypothetical protein
VIAHGWLFLVGSQEVAALEAFPATKNLPGPEARGGVREHRRVPAAT